MSETIFDDQVMTRLRQRNPRYHDTAYLFVLSALQHVLERLDQPRHISGGELAVGVRDLARARFGLMARIVLEHWGIRSTADVGRIVFALVDAGVLIKQDDDRLEDFEDLYDFGEAFEENYPWGSGIPA